MQQDTPWVVFLVLVKVGIVLGYIDFAIRNYRAYRDMHTKTKAATAYLYLTVVFLLCAVCGYLAPCVRLIWPAYRLEAFFNLALLIATFWLVRSARNADLIREVFDVKTQVNALRAKITDFESTLPS